MATKANGSQGPTIVVGFDCNADSEIALREALAMAEARGGEVHLVHALDASPKRPTGTEIARWNSVLTRGANRVNGYVAKRRAALGSPNVKFLVHVRLVSPAEAVLQVATDVDADMIVVGRSVQKGISKLTHRSVSARIINDAACPVLIARAKKHGAIERMPSVEPPCKACLVARRDTGGKEWWCTRHSKKHVLPMHRYSYSRSPIAIHSTTTNISGS